jgi:hypothetical protein
MKAASVISAIFIAAILIGFCPSELGQNVLISKMHGWLLESDRVQMESAKEKDVLLFSLVLLKERECLHGVITVKDDKIVFGSFWGREITKQYLKPFGQLIQKLDQSAKKDGRFIMSEHLREVGFVSSFKIEPDKFTKEQFFSLLVMNIAEVEYALPYFKKVAEGVPVNQVIDEIEDAQKMESGSFEIEPEQRDRVG